MPSNSLKHNPFFYEEAAEMTKTGGWYVDTVNFKVYLDNQGKKILELPEGVSPKIENALSFYREDQHEFVIKLLYKCHTYGVPFEEELRMLTYKKKDFWVRAIGKPIYNDKKIVGVRGVFQNIDENKLRELRIMESLEVIAAQNSRLSNFAHIVSHNLRSHSSNLELVVHLFDTLTNDKEKLALLESVRDISNSLEKTIEHLNEITTIENNRNQQKNLVRFDDILMDVTNSIKQIIKKNHTTIKSDFSKLEEIEYIPAYLESILLNLITNSIKYKHPKRKPEVIITTYKKDHANFMEVADNGSGIDLNLYGNKIFGMYKTFHLNSDATGIGLFITKNQIQSLGGSISVSSEVGIGTTFKVRF